MLLETQLGKAVLRLTASPDTAYGSSPLTSVQSPEPGGLELPETKDWKQTSHLAEKQHKGAVA